MTQAKFKNKQGERVTLPLSVYRYRARKIHLFLFSLLAEKGWTRNGRSRIKNEKQEIKSLKMFPSDIILKFKNIVRIN